MNPTQQDTTAQDEKRPLKRLDRVKGLTHDEFMEQYVIPGKPAILQDAISNWPALKKWEASFWKRSYGERAVIVDGKDYPLKEIVDLTLASDLEYPAPCNRNILLRHRISGTHGSFLCKSKTVWPKQVCPHVQRKRSDETNSL